MIIPPRPSSPVTGSPRTTNSSINLRSSGIRKRPVTGSRSSSSGHRTACPCRSSWSTSTPSTYASTMAWNGQPWCPVIVDVRQHPVMRLPAWVAGRITKHLRDKQHTRQPRVQEREPQSQDNRETPDRHRRQGDQGERDSRATRARASCSHCVIGASLKSSSCMSTRPPLRSIVPEFKGGWSKIPSMAHGPPMKNPLHPVRRDLRVEFRRDLGQGFAEDLRENPIARIELRP